MALCPEAAVQQCSMKKVFLEIWQNSQKNSCVKVYFLINFIEKETLPQVFSREFCKISKNTFLHWIILVAASVCLIIHLWYLSFYLMKSMSAFKNAVKKWKPRSYPRRLCCTYIHEPGFFTWMFSKINLVCHCY